MMYIYFILLSFCSIGYGCYLNKILKIKNQCFGLNGLIGITFLSIISFSTSIFLKHNFIFNSIILIIGIICFIFFLKKVKNSKKEFYFFFITFLLLFLFITIAKNHDDFPYYHFPYIHLLTEYSHPVGIGQLNNGFRTPSSIFFISSLFYLPSIKYHLYHVLPALILGFSNLILLKFILSKKNFYENNFINFLSLIVIIFLNIFFYRLAEHGTDRSGMIMTMIAIIYLFLILNMKQEKSSELLKENLKIFSIIIFFVISLKPFYLVNLALFLPILINKRFRNFFFELLFSKTSFYCILFLIFTFFYTFINSGCIIFPISQTCFENLSWSIAKENVTDVSIWFELWSKAGANPNFVVDDRLKYISGFNWLSNWIDNYFFNKVSDFLIGLFVLNLIMIFYFYKKKKFLNKEKTYYLPIYFILVIFLIEWFLRHPTLRYGGYHIIALITFIPLCLFLKKINLKYKQFFKKSLILIGITVIIFTSRNIQRLEKEMSQYTYKPLKNYHYKFIGGDEKFYLRYNLYIEKNSKNFDRINIVGKNITIINK